MSHQLKYIYIDDDEELTLSVYDDETFVVKYKISTFSLDKEELNTLIKFLNKARRKEFLSKLFRKNK